MKTLRKSLLILNILVVTSFQFLSAQTANKASMPFDMIFIGYDNDIGGTNSEKIALLTMTEVHEGYTFGLVNKIFNAGNWEAYNDDKLVQVSFKVKPGTIFKKGTLFEIKNFNGQISIYSDDSDISQDFEITDPKSTTDSFLKPTGTYLSLYSGYYLSNQKDILLGTVLDVLSIGVSRQVALSLDLGPG